MLIITNAPRGGFLIHRANCPRITPSGHPVTTEEAVPDVVFAARSCSRCSPRPADVGRAIEAARKAEAVPLEPTTATADERVVPCSGACGQVLPLTKFPTRSNGSRGTECRKCRDARRAAAKVAT